MLDLLTSEAAFSDHAEQRGLATGKVIILQGQGIKTLSSLAYCLTVAAAHHRPKMPFGKSVMLSTLQVLIWLQFQL